MSCITKQRHRGLLLRHSSTDMLHIWPLQHKSKHPWNNYVNISPLSIQGPPSPSLFGLPTSTQASSKSDHDPTPPRFISPPQNHYQKRASWPLYSCQRENPMHFTLLLSRAPHATGMSRSLRTPSNFHSADWPLCCAVLCTLDTTKLNTLTTINAFTPLNTLNTMRKVNTQHTQQNAQG